MNKEDGLHNGLVSTHHGELEVQRLIDDRLPTNHALRWVGISRHP